MATASPGSAVPPNYVPDPAHPYGHFKSLGDRWAALTPARRIVIFVVALAAVVVVVSLLGAARQPPEPPPRCPTEPCSPPQDPGGGNPAGGIVVEPAPDSTAPPLRLEGQWTNDAMGVGLEYNTRSWTVDPADSAERSVFMTGGSGAYSVWVYVVPASEATPATLVANDLADLRKTWAPDLTDETDPKFQALGVPTIGYRQAEASMLVGTHGIEPVTVVLLSGGNDRVSVLVEVASNKSERDAAFKRADPVVNSFRWP